MKNRISVRILCGILVCLMLISNVSTFAVSGFAAATDDDSIVIKTQPESVMVEKGAKATVKVVAEGTGLTYKWYFKNAGQTKFSLTTSFTGNSYSIEMTEARAGRAVYCVITDANGNTVTTDTAVLEIDKSLNILQQPESVMVANGEKATVKVVAEGTGLTYKWYFKNAGQTKFSLTTSFTGNSYSIEMTEARAGRAVYCVITDANGNTVTTDTAVLEIDKSFNILQQPESVMVEKGAKATVKVVAEGTGLTYKWYFKNAGQTKFSLTTSFTGNSYSVEMNEARAGRAVYCVVTNEYGTVVQTNTAILTLKKQLKITKQPQTVYLNEGKNAWFYVQAEGNSPSYSWQYSDDFGATWEQSDVAISAYALEAISSYHCRMVRCVVTDANGDSVTSDPVSLFIESMLKIEITQQPKDATVSIGDSVEFGVEAEGLGLHFMWQYSIDGTNWNDIGTTEPIYSMLATEDAIGRIYRCKIWDDYGNTEFSDVVRIIDDSQLILVQPKNWVGCASGQAFFEVVVTENVVSCQWQVSSNNGVSWNTSSVQSAYYSTVATEEKNGWLYRCIVVDSEGREQVSNEVTIELNNTFQIVAQPTDACGNFNQSVVFSIQASGTNVQFEWQRSTDGDVWETVANNVPRLPQTIQMYNVGRYYRCVVTNGDGRTLTSDVVQLKWISSGFFTYKDNRYYVKENGCLAIGFETIDGDLYYFNDKGVMLTGHRALNDKIYYFMDNGAAAKGFTYVHNVCGTLYFGEDGSAATGWATIDGNDYYFNEKTGARSWGITQIGDKEYFFDHETGIRTYGFVKIGLNDYMYFEKGAHDAYTGLKTIDDKLYYFAESGKLRGVAQESMQTVGGKTYYFDPETKQAVTGLITYGENTYFMGSDYVMVVNDFVTIGQKTYLASANGMLCHGLITFNDKKYYLNPNTGVAVSGWVNMDGATMYFDPSTYEAKIGFVTIDGIKYFFTSNGYLQTGVLKVGDSLYYCAEQNNKKTGFVELNEKTFYVYDNQKVATGLATINGKQYYFGTDGVMRTGFTTVSSKRYYFDPENGVAKVGLMQMSNSYTYFFNGTAGCGSGLTKIGEDLYYLDSSGIVRYGRNKINDKYYYFDPATGKALSGWQFVQGADGVVNKAYFDSTTYCAVTGLKKIDGKLYYFDSYGWVKSGKRTVNGVTYFFSPVTYEAYTGWYKNTDESYSYFDGENGQISGPGIHEIDGAYYYFNAYGRRKTGVITVDGVKMYFDPITAQPVTGFVYTNEKLYYFDGLNGAKTGLQTIGGNQYYFDKSGPARTGLQVIGNVKYYFDEATGVRKDGLILNKANNTYYIFDVNSSTGVKTSNATIGGVLYVCKSNGALRTGYCHSSLSGLGYNAFLDTTTGEQQLGLISFKNSSGATVTYYFKNNGCLTNVTAVKTSLNNALKKDGWHTIEGVKYYVKNGAFYKGKKTIGGKTYYFSSLTGAMLTGLRRIGNNRYYFDPKTGEMKTGMLIIDGKRFYFEPSTGAQYIGIKKPTSYTYYFAENGQLTGTIQLGNDKYTFASSGAGRKVEESAKTPAPTQAKVSAKWRTVDGAQCYYNMNGKRVTRLQVIDGKLYYFNGNGVMQTGLVKVGNSYYYFDKTGARSGKITINNKEYYFSPINFAMLTGMLKIDGAFCYYNESGVKQIGWIKTSTGDRLYVNDSGMKTGLVKISGKTYYFGTDGFLRTGLQQVPASDGTQMTCLFDNDGAMVTGLVKNSGGIYYYEPNTGARVTGFAQVDGKEYYFDPNTGKAKVGLCNINGVYCYFDSNTAERKYGLQKVNGYLRYFTEGDKGTGYATGLKVVGGKTYLFTEEKGIALTGFQIVNDVKYYFDENTCASVSGIYRVENGHAYYFNAGGGIKTGWVNVGSKSYFFYPATGMMAEGLSSVGNHLYYFDYDKGLLTDTTVTVGGVEYKFDENGHGFAMGDSVLATLINTGIDNFDKAYGNENDMENPSSFTCSQLVMYVYESVGIDLMRRPPRQYHMLFNGVYDSQIITDINDAKAGDIMFFIATDCGYGESCDFENELHHVGIYLGDGKILESYGIEGDTINNGPMIRDVADGLWSALLYGLIRINGVND